MTAKRHNRPATGLRDDAILTLVSTYGMRAGEVTRQRLNDINRRGERSWVHHTKIGLRWTLPTLPAVGHTLLAYLRKGQPTSTARAVLIRMHAP